MSNAVVRVFIFLLVVLATYIWIGNAITAMTGGEKKAGGKVEITPEGGEKIFWGKGRCFTCHSLGDEGSAVRCPNLGQFGEKFALPIGARAAERAKERSDETGHVYTTTDYLIESVADPSAYIVEGYKDEMAIVYAPPISLNLDEIKAVILYLQSQGGDLNMEELSSPTELATSYYDRISAATAAGGGDPGNGEEMFVDNCADCHMLNGDGGNIGPDLTGISEKGLKFIQESVLYPAKKITKGYETWEIEKTDGRKITGLKTRDTATEIDIVKDSGDLVTIAKADIKEMQENKDTSIMPNDLTEALTIKDFQDVMAFMMMQKVEEEVDAE